MSYLSADYYCCHQIVTLTSCWGGLEVVWLPLWLRGPAAEEESDSLGRAECLLPSPGGDLLSHNLPQLSAGGPAGRRGVNTMSRQMQSTHLMHELAVRKTHLILLKFSSLAVQAVENELFVQLMVGVADKPPNSFSLCFKVLPGAQSGLQIAEKQNNNIHGYAHTEVKRGSMHQT